MAPSKPDLLPDPAPLRTQRAAFTTLGSSSFKAFFDKTRLYPYCLGMKLLVACGMKKRKIIEPVISSISTMNTMMYIPSCFIRDQSLTYGTLSLLKQPQSLKLYLSSFSLQPLLSKTLCEGFCQVICFEVKAFQNSPLLDFLASVL